MSRRVKLTPLACWTDEPKLDFAAIRAALLKIQPGQHIVVRMLGDRDVLYNRLRVNVHHWTNRVRLATGICWPDHYGRHYHVAKLDDDNRAGHRFKITRRA